MSTNPATQPESELLRQDNGRISTLTLNRPGQYNALSEELLQALSQQLDRLAADENIHVVVLTGAGKAFCPGHDLKQMRANADETYYRKLFGLCGEVMQKIVKLPQPVIAKVQGMATAAGCQLVAACDLAVAADDVRFAVSGINVGLFCSTPAVTLSRNVSRKRAMEMLLTGDFIDAPTAQDYGLINHAVPRDELDSRVDALAARIAIKPKDSIRMGKKLFYRQIENSLSGAFEEAAEVMACNMMQADTVEGVDAFIEKRKPRWAE